MKQRQHGLVDLVVVDVHRCISPADRGSSCPPARRVNHVDRQTLTFFQQLIDQNVRSIPDRDPAYRHPALLVLDEFPVLGALPHLASAFSYIAGDGLRVVMVAQSPAQLQSPHLYGPELASVILDNCGVECVFGTKNRNVAEDLSVRAGDQTVSGVTQNCPRFFGFLQWQKQNEARHPHRRPILLPQEVTRLPSHKQLVLRAGIPPVLADKLRWDDDPAFCDLRRKPPVPDEIGIPIGLDDGGALLPEVNEASARRMQPEMGRDHTDDDEDEREQERSRMLTLSLPGGRG